MQRSNVFIVKCGAIKGNRHTVLTNPVCPCLSVGYNAESIYQP